MYTIYSKTNCSFCDKAKATLKTNNHDYKEFQIGRDLTTHELMDQFPSAKSLPIILKDEQYIGGLKELIVHLFPPLETN